MSPTDRHLFVPLAETYRLRVSLRHDSDGRPTWIALTRGYGSGEDFRPDLSGTFTIDASYLPDLRAALDELAGDTEGRSKAPGATAPVTAPRRHVLASELGGEGVEP